MIQNPDVMSNDATNLDRKGTPDDHAELSNRLAGDLKPTEPFSTKNAQTVKPEFQLYARSEAMEKKKVGFVASVCNVFKLFWVSTTLFSYQSSKLSRHEPGRKNSGFLWFIQRALMIFIFGFAVYVVAWKNYKMVRTDKSQTSSI